jgi:hypothetical protein
LSWEENEGPSLWNALLHIYLWGFSYHYRSVICVTLRPQNSKNTYCFIHKFPERIKVCVFYTQKTFLKYLSQIPPLNMKIKLTFQVGRHPSH